MGKKNQWRAPSWTQEVPTQPHPTFLGRFGTSGSQVGTIVQLFLSVILNGTCKSHSKRACVFVRNFGKQIGRRAIPPGDGGWAAARPLRRVLWGRLQALYGQNGYQICDFVPVRTFLLKRRVINRTLPHQAQKVMKTLCF